MNIGKSFYPYPVLSDFSNDYIDSYIKVNYELRVKGFLTNIICVSVDISDDKIESFLKNNLAEIILHVECPRTSYRTTYSISPIERYFEFEIDSNIITDKIELSTLIVTKTDIDYYHNKNFNTTYYGTDYYIKNLNAGSILAATVTQNVIVENKGNDFQDIPSIIKVGESKDDFMDLDMDGDVIIIKLPKDEYKKYHEYSNTDLSDIIMCATILPSLIHVLDKLKSNFDPVDTNLQWVRVIEDKLKTKNISIEDINESYSSVELAQMILEDPLKRGLDSISTVLNEDD